MLLSSKSPTSAYNNSIGVGVGSLYLEEEEVRCVYVVHTMNNIDMLLYLSIIQEEESKTFLERDQMLGEVLL